MDSFHTSYNFLRARRLKLWWNVQAWKGHAMEYVFRIWLPKPPGGGLAPLTGAAGASHCDGQAPLPRLYVPLLAIAPGAEVEAERRSCGG